VTGPGAAHQVGEEESGGTAADDSDLHRKDL
jgi:hypothetical protein